MVILLIILFIIILTELFFLLLLNSRIIVEINKCDLTYSIEKQKELNLNKLNMNLKIYILKYIRILKISVTEDYFEILRIKFKLDNLKKLKAVKDKKLKKDSVLKFILKNLNKIKPIITKIEFIFEVGTIDMLFSVFLIPVISTIIPSYISKYYIGDGENYKMEIYPIYNEKNSFKLQIKAEILLKMKNIIDIILISK